MRLIGLVILAAAMIVVIRVGMIVVPVAGFFRDLPETDLSQCRRIDVAPGTEDIEIDADLGVAFVAAADRRAWYSTGAPVNTPSNGVYAISLDGSDAVRRVSPEGFSDFHPHGISLWRGPEGGKRLFVVNHPTSGEEIVEIFQIETDTSLTHLRSISFPEMYSPNDVVAVGPDAFYATNDRRYDHGPKALAELYLGLPLTGVVYWDGAQGRDVVGGLMYANGINKSLDGSKIYVAEFLDQVVQVYDRDPASGALAHDRSLPIDTGPDNLVVARDGAIWIGGHPKALEFQKHAEDADHISPSHVVQLDPETGLSETIFTSLKGEINGSATGAVWDDTLFVGAVFDGHVMACRL
ncbi:MAG: SMP-30/gluconolactonase/LRE family protein [Pseudomonadota bacterium]